MKTYSEFSLLVNAVKKGYCLFFMGSIMILHSCTEIISEDNITEAPVMLTAPLDGAVLTKSDIVLSWTPVEGADQYHVQIATPSFEAALQMVKDTVVTESNFSMLLSANDYEWRVRAINSAYETEFSLRTFSIQE